jgi:two-component system response regulator FixJ
LTVTVHIVDDDDAVRRSLRFLLEVAGLSVATYASGAELLRADLSRAGCVLTDMRMPGTDGLQLQAQLAARGVRLPVILMTGHADVPLAVQALKAGAADFLEKPFKDGELLAAVQAALARDSDAVRAAERLAALTAREREVLDLLVAGKSSKEIAKALGTSPRTIDVHRARVFHKLEARSLPELVHLVLTARPHAATDA